MKNLKRHPGINKIIRFLIKKGIVLFPDLLKPIRTKWNVSGFIDVKISNDIKFKYFSECDDNIADQIYYNPKTYSEINELLLFAAFAKKSENIFDIGANTGLYSIVASKVKPTAKIWAFEPYITNLERLKKNIKLNNINNIDIVQNIIGNKDALVKFSVPEQNRVCDVLSVDQNFTEQFYNKWITFKQIDIEQISLDTFILKKFLNNIDLIKIDVEDYELAVLKGAEVLLQMNDPIILCEIFVNDSKIKFYEEFMKPLGYYCYLILKDGIVRSETLVFNPDCRNYLFSKRKSVEISLSYINMDTIVNELGHP